MIARLTRFYGGDPWRWLAELPMGIVRACMRMLPRLQAEEAIEAAERVGVGSGAYSEADQNAIMSRWRAAQQPAGQPGVARATPQLLARTGIGFRRVPRAAAPQQAHV